MLIIDLMQLLSCAVFYLPAEEAEKITLCISVLLSLGTGLIKSQAERIFRTKEFGP